MFTCFQGKKDIQWEDIMMEKNYNAVDAYAQSKLANILFNLELSKKVKCKKYAVHIQLQCFLTTSYASACFYRFLRSAPRL